MAQNLVIVFILIYNFVRNIIDKNTLTNYSIDYDQTLNGYRNAAISPFYYFNIHLFLTYF